MKKHVYDNYGGHMLMNLRRPPAPQAESSTIETRK